MLNVIKEYLAEVGFVVDKNSFNEAQKSLSQLEKGFNSLLKKLAESDGFQRFSKNLDRAIAKVTQALAKNPALKKLGDIGKKMLDGAFRTVSKAMLDLAKFLSKFLGSGGGLAAIIGAGVAAITAGIIAAIAAITAAITAATAVFMSKMAAADMEVQKFALSLFTTTQNARSLKAVMDSMGLSSLEDLKAVNMNPELRAQFLSLRKTTQGLEPGADAKQGFKNIRSAGLEMQRFQVILSYFWQNLGGRLGKVFAGPLKRFEKLMAGINTILAKNMDKWVNDIARILDFVIVIADLFIRGFGVLLKMALELNRLTGLMKWLRLFGDIALFLLKSSLPKNTKEAAAFAAGGPGALAMTKVGEKVSEKTGQALKGFTDQIKGAISKTFHGPLKSENGEATPLGSFAQNGHRLSDFNKKFLSYLSRVVPGAWQVTSGIEPRGSATTGHRSGNKFDLGVRGKSDTDILGLLRGLMKSPGFVESYVELPHARYARLMNQLRSEGMDTSKLKDGSGVGWRSGDNIDVRTKPVELTFNIYGNGQDPSAIAQTTLQTFKQALNLRSNTGFA